jgi:hypothetical protein
VGEVIEALLPSQARIAFLVAAERHRANLDGHEFWRLPSDPPPGSDALADSLQDLEQSGIEFVVIPEAAFEWMDEHDDVADRLRGRHRFVMRQEHLCEIYELQAPPAESSPKRASSQAAESQDESPKTGEGQDPGGERRRSFGEKLRDLLFPSRRNGRRP